MPLRPTAGESLELIRPDWPAPGRVRAASSTRHGGVSRGAYASLNIGRSGGDDPAAVDENRRRLFDALRLPAEPNWIRQVHGTAVVRAPLAQAEPDADACWTSEPGTVCLVQSADCLPVLLCEETGAAVAAAHAGWRGLSAGVLENTVRAMDAAPSRLLAWLGPAIGPRAFEVGAEVREAFLAADAAADAAFVPAAAPQKFMADLYALARLRLQRAGVERVYGGGWCTHTEAQRFHSFRRDGASGRMASLIWIESEA